MSEFEATGTLVIESIENEATDDLQESFAISASSAASSRSRPGRTGQRITAQLDRGVDLAETRNDLLRDLQETQEDSTFSITRALRSLGRLTGGALLGLGGALSTLALSESPNQGPQPSPEPDTGGTDSESGSETTTPEPVALTAADAIAAAATVTPAALIQSGATIAATDVIGGKATVGSSDVIGDKASVESSDTVGEKASIGAEDVVTAAVALSTGNIVTGAVTLTANDVVSPASLSAEDVVSGTIDSEDVITALTVGATGSGVAAGISGASKLLGELDVGDDALKALTLGSSIGVGGAAGIFGMSKIIESGKLFSSTGNVAGIPGTVLPQLLSTADRQTPAELIPSPKSNTDSRTRSTRGGDRAPARVTFTNDVTVNSNSDISRREKRDIIDQAVREVEKQLTNNL